MITQLKAENENQTLKINQLEAENENQTLKINHQTLKINQLEAELEMLQDRNDSYGNFNFSLA